ncbi:hypothetical protein J2X20_003700 [Pelomonas saccharophila]|uniref:Uncharacterized protein n=1 Tax=Roseateles saccharophilus TaxID=304 RepID=A0ABU1YQA1_ROSSA|nr:hypothetical protein [Roseateles saccharophilus]MDR7271042.1 hypothetical protein [Roseateles saccharophilus]
MKQLLAILCLAVGGLAHAGYTATPNDWACTNKVGGTWTHGRAPSGCDANAFGPDSFVRGNYGGVIFSDASANLVDERKRYMQAMYPAIRDASERYLRSRKPAVSARELEAFQRGTFATLRQETFWSHYRDAQTAAGQPWMLKMMRGDSGHGHGMMQVDDRYHFVQLQQGKGWNMMQNFTYAIDIYYAAWESAPASCLGGVTSPTGTAAEVDEYWRSRARSAWSAYNGGPTKVCRWQNTADVNVAKDNGYRDNFDARLWLVDIADLNKAAGIDVACLMDDGPQCPVPVGGAVEAGKLLQVGSAACVLNAGTLECVDDVRDAACLAGRAPFDENGIVQVYVAQTAGYARIDHNRHQLCRSQVAGLQSLASAIATLQPLELRSAPNGMVLGLAAAGSYQVLDFMVSGAQQQKRLYRIRADINGVLADGWIDAGDAASHAGIAVGAAPAGPGAIAYAGDWVKVVPNLNMRATPGGGLLVAIPANTAVQVKEVFGTASANNLYYRVEYLHNDGVLREGWIFAGNLYPASTLANWALPTAAPSAHKHAHCPNGTRYDSHLRQCMSASQTYGPFTAATVQACVDGGGGAVCTANRATVVDGVALAMPIWSKTLATAATGNGDCPRGAARSMAHRFHCTEAVTRNGAAEIDVYGPFGTALVNACLARSGNAAYCRTNRWPAAAFLSLQP